MHLELEKIFQKHRDHFRPVVPFTPGVEKVIALNLSVSNSDLDEGIFTDTKAFGKYVATLLHDEGATYGIGGYLENRALYKRSALFETTAKSGDGSVLNNAIASTEVYPSVLADQRQRSIHLGMDIWGAENTPVMAPLSGVVHSLSFNDHFGDYGATIILQHQLDEIVFYSLYGHLSKADLAKNVHDHMAAGEVIGHFGPPKENGHWPPHLHFQLMLDMEMKSGDYPGVCHIDDLVHYQQNCPNPDLVLQLERWLN